MSEDRELPANKPRKRVYSAPAIEATADFETLQMGCATQGGNPSCDPEVNPYATGPVFS